MINIAKATLILAWISLIFALLALPQPHSVYELSFLDKVAHFLVFGILAYLIIALFQNRSKKRLQLLTIFAIVFSLTYSLFMEYLQQFIPGREPDWLDFLAGLLGVALLAYWAYQKYKKPKLLLHICCAGCGAFVGQSLKDKYSVALFYCNPNIESEAEWQKRFLDVKKIAKIFNLSLASGEKYNHSAWLKEIKGLEKEKEGGKRCETCYEIRLSQTAQKAKKENFEYFATTLSVSPHKNAVIIQKLGQELARKYTIKYLDKDFKKNDGFKKASAVSRALGLYRQNYCGCEFSKR